MAGRLGVHPFTGQPGRAVGAVSGGLQRLLLEAAPQSRRGVFSVTSLVAVASPFSCVLSRSQDPVWSKPTFSFLHTFFAGPLSSTESSITRVSVAKPWGTPVFKVSRLVDASLVRVRRCSSQQG